MKSITNRTEDTMSAMTTQQVTYAPGIAFATTRAGAERQAREAAAAAETDATRSTAGLFGRLFTRHAR
jgi:hypothetical protein